MTAGLSDSTDYSEYESSEDDLDFLRQEQRAKKKEKKKKEKEAVFNMLFTRLKGEIYKTRKADRRLYVVRSFFQSIMFACCIIPRFFVMYIIKLEEGLKPGDRQQRNLQLFKILLPLLSSVLTLILTLDGTIFMELRFLAAIIFALFAVANLFLLILHWKFLGITFTMPAVVMNGTADLIMALLILVVKSKWPFKKRRR